MIIENLVKIDDLTIETRTFRKGNGIIFYFHGNSSAASAFDPLIFCLDELGCEFTQIAVSLPGHGKSSMSTNFCESLSIEKLGKFCRKIVDYFDPEYYIVVGQSLGGHALLEGLPLFKGAAGLILLSSPPINLETISIAFKQDPSNGLLFQGLVTDEEAHTLAACFLSEMTSPFLEQLANQIVTTDVRFRQNLGKSIANGNVLDEVSLLANTSIPCMMLNAEQDAFLNSNYYTSLPLPETFSYSRHVLSGGHAIHLEQPGNVATHIKTFVENISVGTCAQMQQA